jgi:predicted amidohydrolase YtcJ
LSTSHTTERSAEPAIAADLILYNGTILTMATPARAEALAVRSGRILEVGATREILRLAGAKTRLLDLRGRAALPGFIETHNHPLFYGYTVRIAVDASTPPNECIDDILERIAERARGLPPGTWIRAERYDDTLLREKRHPTRTDLDRAAPHHPVYMTHVTGHFSVANSRALELAGVSAATPDPPGGFVARDASGSPTGLLAEAAAQLLVSQHLPPLTMEEMLDCLATAGAQYVKAGVTSTHDLAIGFQGTVEAIAAYRRAKERNAFQPRVYGFLSEHILPELAEGRLGPLSGAIAGIGDDHYRLAGVKMWADGSIQGFTGALSEPYYCKPETTGFPIYDEQQLSTRIRALRDAGWHVAVHANGDAAIEALVRAYERNSSGGQRFRIEHCQTGREDQLERIAEHDIHVSFFIKHVYYWGDRHRELFLGPKRAQRISPLHSAQERGIRFALHSDCPITPVMPLEGIWAAVNRITSGGEPLGLEQRVDVETALRGYTSNAAYLSYEEDRKGTLEPGKFGDIVIVDRDPTAVAPEELYRLRVETTIIGGEIVYSALSS